MKRDAWVNLLIICAACLFAVNVTAKDQSDTGEMTAYIEENGLAKFVSVVSDHGWKAPIIYSKWHVENISKPEQRAEQRKARDFGFVIATQLTSYAGMVIGTTNTVLSLRQCKEMLDLVDWLNSVGGYGNLLVGKRALDLAAVSLAKCVADETMPIETCDSFITRLNPKWAGPRMRMQVLNDEAGRAVFACSSRDDKAVQLSMEDKWADEFDKIAEEQIKHLSEDQTRKSGNRHDSDATNLAETCNIFLDDEMFGPTALVNTWNKKFHYGIVLEFGTQNTLDVPKFAEFRRSVKRFPRKENGERHTDKAEMMRAFWRAWTPYGTNDASRQLYTYGGELYYKVQKGQMLPQETLLP